MRKSKLLPGTLPLFAEPGEPVISKPKHHVERRPQEGEYLTLHRTWRLTPENIKAWNAHLSPLDLYIWNDGQGWVFRRIDEDGCIQ